MTHSSVCVCVIWHRIDGTTCRMRDVCAMNPKYLASHCTEAPQVNGAGHYYCYYIYIVICLGPARPVPSRLDKSTSTINICWNKSRLQIQCHYWCHVSNNRRCVLSLPRVIALRMVMLCGLKTHHQQQKSFWKSHFNDFTPSDFSWIKKGISSFCKTQEKIPTKKQNEINAHNPIWFIVWRLKLTANHVFFCVQEYI